MKKTIFILGITFILSLGYYCYYIQSDEKILKDFAYEVVDSNVKFEKIITRYIKFKRESKSITLLFLELYRDEFKKNPGSVKIYSYYEAIKMNKENEIVSKDYDNVYFIYLNKKVRMPILLNKERKIVAISVMCKGTCYFIRLDGVKY